MAISKNIRDFVDSLIDYYISEAASYKQIAEEYVPEIDSVTDTAIGIISGLVYSGFLQAYKNQKISPSLEDIQEFHRILKDRAPLIKKAMLEDTSLHHFKKETNKIENLG